MADLPAHLGALCATCAACGRRVIFWPLSVEAKLSLEDAARRLKCSECGAGDPRLYRATSEAEAKRWFSDR